MIYVILLILGLITFSGEIAMILAWIIAYIRYKNDKILNYSPKAAVIVPCKDVDRDFEENILSICNQDYEDYKIIFVTDSKTDPAYKELKKIVGKKENVTITISEFIKGSSGKISALIKGIEKAKEPEVYVFADCDIKPHKKWLKNLVSHLDEEDIGATTGYRFYFPENTQSLILSVWNMACSLSLFFRSSNYTWGGSTAIKKTVFDKLDIINKWKKGFSDDLILTDALRKEKYKIRFVPKSIVKSPPEGNFSYIFKWGARQLTWIKWYYPTMYIVSVVCGIGIKISTILGFILLVYGYTLPGLLMVSTIFLEMITGGVAHYVMKNIMHYPKQMHSSTLPYILLMPLIFFILAYNNLCSLFKNKIKWGGRTYRKKDIVKKL